MKQRVFWKAVNRRADKLMEEYRSKASIMHSLLREEEDNRVRRRLDQSGDMDGLVVGQFNEVSDNTHMLLEKMADSRVALVSRIDWRG